jgi:HemY protein
LHFFRRLPANRRNKKDSQRLKEGNAALLEGMHALAEGNIAKAEAAAQRAHGLIRSEDLQLLMGALNERKLKSETT